MARLRSQMAVALGVALLSSCASAEDRLNEGVALQQQGRYMQAVYRYAEAVEKDRELAPARERLLAAGDSAIMAAMDDADALERRSDPVGAAVRYEEIDAMLARVRQVGMRLSIPSDYSTIRRAIFDNAIDWRMSQGDEATAEGRWEDARRLYVSARRDFLPSRQQVEGSLDAETRLLLEWAGVELQDQRPRLAHELAEEAVRVRSSPTRETVLSVREIQQEALELGTVVVAIVPVTAEPGVRSWLGGEFEVELDNDLTVDHWSRPPLFVDVADAIVMRRELRGLLRGQASQSPLLAGRAAELIGAHLAVLIRLVGIEVVEEDVDRDGHQAVIERSVQEGARRSTRADTVTYETLEGELRYYLESEITLVDGGGREVERFATSAEASGPFQRGEFDGDPALLSLQDDRAAYFDPGVIADQVAAIETALLDELATSIAAATFDRVLATIR